MLEILMVLGFITSFLYGCFITSWLYERKEKGYILCLENPVEGDTQEGQDSYWFYLRVE